ncbi:MAG TPA: urease subunit beta [Acidimicrobiales bacterium]|nr:urease subunit beta [Acidimicrobiales bacterium]
MSGGMDMADGVVPGEVIPGDGTIELFAGAALVEVTVTNTGDRAVQVGSHYHLAEANPALAFDRDAARGHRLAIPAGTSVRFEPGIERRVELVPLGGRRVVAGLRGEVAGPLDAGSSPHTDFLRGSGRSSDQIRGENPGEG